MENVRIIARLDVKGPNVVKGIRMEGLRVIGDPRELAKKYYAQGADELLYIDTVASLYERNNLIDIVKRTTSDGIYIPITVGGGVRSIEDINTLLRSGADKVAINTAAVKNPGMIKEAAEKFGSQCVVLSIEAKQKENNRWEAYIDNGRERTNKDVVEWAKEAVSLGAGEILLTSVDRDGTMLGCDIDLVKSVSSNVGVPVIAAGGVGSLDDVENCIKSGKADAVSIASILHYGKETINNLKNSLDERGINVRHTFEIPVENTVKDTTTPEYKISILDYDAGNIFSIKRALEFLGNEVKIIRSDKEVREAKILVIPGVGAFKKAMDVLKTRKLIDPIKEHVKSGKPLLGICLGMQLLMDESEEYGRHEGLGLLKGRVIGLKSPSETTIEGYRVPHINFAELSVPEHKRPLKEPWKNTILEGVSEGSETYFVHSFFPDPDDKTCVIAVSPYGGQNVTSVIQKDNVIACQFHPEKSGKVGMEILKNFCISIKDMEEYERKLLS